jgi:hypothetical protein
VFDSNLAPIVGQQITLAADSPASVPSRIALLEARAEAGECDLVVRGQSKDTELGFLYDVATKRFVPNRARDPRLTDAQLRELARSTELTFTAAPTASGRRIALDRDGDGALDGDDRDPTDPTCK